MWSPLRSPVRFTPLAVASVCALSTRAYAVDEACTAPQLHVDLPAGSPWADRIGVLQSELRDARIDRCVQVQIRAAGAEVLVDVTSRGRTASRRLTEPSELVRTVEALVVLPPTFDVPAPVSPSERLPDAEPAPVPVEPIHIELATAAAARVGGNFYVGGGFEAAADVVVANYILGVSGRWDVSDGYVAEPTAGGFTMESGALGVLLGHRAPLHAAGAFLDVLVAGRIVVENQEQTESNVDGETLDTRIGVGLRASPAKSVGLRAFVAADLEASPARIAHAKRLAPTLPILPAWTGGVVVGLMWGPR